VPLPEDPRATAAASVPASRKKRVLSGMRPTGRLHIGHYFGALRNWVKLQNDPQYECFFFIADWHALTSDYADTSGTAQNAIEITTDYLASGLDPQKSTIFLQSLVPEHAELYLLLSMVTPLSWLERVPTYKEALENVKGKDLRTYGFLGYPVLQTSDIVMYGEPSQELLVPVGEDQKSHVELSREIVRRFNVFYGFETKDELFQSHNEAALRRIVARVSSLSDDAHEEFAPVFRQSFKNFSDEIGFVNFQKKMGDDARFFSYAERLREPEVMLTETPRIPGTDGRKMSKSYNNFILLSESDDSIDAKTKAMVTDPARKRRTDPGNPDVCPVYDWHKLFSPPDILTWSAQGCRTAAIGCIECKKAMSDNLIRWIAPIRERRRDYEKNPGRVLELLDEGSKRAQNVSRETMSRVREAVFGWQKKRTEVAGPASESSTPRAEGLKGPGARPRVRT